MTSTPTSWGLLKQPYKQESARLLGRQFKPRLAPPRRHEAGQSPLVFRVNRAVWQQPHVQQKICVVARCFLLGRPHLSQAPMLSIMALVISPHAGGLQGEKQFLGLVAVQGPGRRGRRPPDQVLTGLLFVRCEILLTICAFAKSDQRTGGGFLNSLVALLD